MESVCDYVDVVRLGWGSAYRTRELRRKLDVYRSHGVPPMVGGALTELAWVEGKLDALRRWLDEPGVANAQVSGGVAAVAPAGRAGPTGTHGRARAGHAV